MKCQKNCEKCQLVSPRAQDEALQRLVSSTAERYSVYCHRGETEPENNHIYEADHLDF